MRRTILVASLLLAIACAGILAGCGTNATSTPGGQPQLGLRFTDTDGKPIIPTSETTELNAGMTLKATAAWTPQPLPIEITIRVDEASSNNLVISNEVKGLEPSMSVQIKKGRTYRVKATATDNVSSWSAGEVIFVCPEPVLAMTFEQVQLPDNEQFESLRLLTVKIKNTGNGIAKDVKLLANLGGTMTAYWSDPSEIAIDPHVTEPVGILRGYGYTKDIKIDGVAGPESWFLALTGDNGLSIGNIAPGETRTIEIVLMHPGFG